MRRLLFLLALVLPLFAWSSSTRAAPRPTGTITTATLPVYQWMFLGCCPLNPPFCVLQGSLDARFEASPVVGGWDITALFRPQQLTASGDVNGSVGGTATISISLPTDGYSQIRADGLHLKGWKLFVAAELTVDTNGAIAVLSHSVVRVKKKSCGGGCAD